jgi:3-dehydroquinate dehydratase-1
MTTFDPCIFKIATYCNSPLDAIRLLELGEVIRARGKKSIILGMGPNGLATRIFGTLWGNELCYAPLENAEASAPGQISLEEFEKIFMIIKNQHT